MFPHNYALEKLSAAVRILATGEGDARSRLISAFSAFGLLKPDAVRQHSKLIISRLKRKLLNAFQGVMRNDVNGLPTEMHRRTFGD